MQFHIDPDIGSARTLDAAFYTSQEYFELSKSRIFAKTWHYLGDHDAVAVAGKAMPVTLLDKFMPEPLVVTRDNDKQLHCLSNVCTHRGALLIQRTCKLHDIRCPYHGRRFSLAGQFLSMPEFKEVKNFPAAADNLPQLPLHAFGKWLFTSLDASAASQPFFADMEARVGWMPFDQFVFRPDLSRDYEIQAHWALYCENYLEGFHIPYVHASLNQVIDYANYTTELFKYSNLQLGIAKPGELIFDLPLQSPDHGKRVAGYYFFVFPNMMFNFYPWGLSINVVQPLASNHTKVSFLTYVWDENKLEQGAGSDLNRVELEDEAVVESVQQGISSRLYQGGRYSVTRETGTHHFHRMLAEFMNNEA
ncbi:MAG: aromatic ring-hydroxylating dioxygenase subunit alpha, partial [Bacteroidia bacterium]|nr:aromatic ring-hydroxylating dioxygenase subunit alpha [Bacteroidia bacterium]